MYDSKQFYVPNWYFKEVNFPSSKTLMPFDVIAFSKNFDHFLVTYKYFEI